MRKFPLFHLTIPGSANIAQISLPSAVAAAVSQGNPTMSLALALLESESVKHKGDLPIF